MVGRPKNENRELALLYGEKTYRGSEHGCGTNERYTVGGSCVHCARRKALDQRQALMEKQQAASTPAQERDAEANEPLDNESAPVYPEPWD